MSNADGVTRQADLNSPIMISVRAYDTAQSRKLFQGHNKMFPASACRTYQRVQNSNSTCSNSHSGQSPISIQDNVCLVQLGNSAANLECGYIWLQISHMILHRNVDRSLVSDVYQEHLASARQSCQPQDSHSTI